MPEQKKKIKSKKAVSSKAAKKNTANLKKNITSKMDHPKLGRRKKFISKPSKQAAIIYERVEKDKKLAMWSGVIFVMIIIVLFWINMTKKSIEQSIQQNDIRNAAVNWEDFSIEMDGKIDQLKNDLDKIRQYEAKANKENEEKGRDIFSDIYASSTNSSSTTIVY